MKATGVRSLLLLFLLPAGPVLADFAGGDGSAEDPWQIATAEQLDEIRNDLEAHYILVADIDLREATGDPSGAFWNDGAGWEPIGRTRGDSFIGSLDGNGFTITGLSIDRAGESQAGLFGWISFGAELTGLALEAVDITGGSHVGGLLVTNFGGTVESSYVTGSVKGDELVGGLVGRNLSGTVENSYLTGNVSGREKVGALLGSNWAELENSYATGSVSGDSDVGGLVGVSSTSVEDSYWNTETIGLESSAGGGTGLSSAEMRQQSSFAGFDFDTTWQIRGSGAFPVLKANPQDPPPTGSGDTGSAPGNPENASNEFSGTVSITGSGVFNGVRVTGAIDSIRLPDEFDTVDTGPGRGDGELTILGDEARAAMRPYRVRQASPGQEKGVFINEDGDIVLVTADGREVSSHPVVADRAVFNHGLEELGLELEHGERASMRLLPAEGLPGSAHYFSARADMLAVPATSAGEEGLFFRPVPELSGASVAYLVFTDESDTPMLQELVPVPADWPALKGTLAATPGISDVRMDPQGFISASVNGQTVRARMEYEVGRSARDVDESDQRAVLTPAGDVNGDDTEDFRVLYPDGDTQLLMIFP